MNKDTVIRKILIPLYRKLKTDEHRGNTVEIRDVVFELDPRERYLDYGETRKASREYIKNEFAWYDSQDLSIIGHKGIENNKVWRACASAEGRVNSNYGYLVFSAENGLQFENAARALVKDKNSRQSVIIYNRPQMHTEHNDGIHATRDFTCTMYTQHFIENDNTLTYIVYMRSNDAIFGLQNDYSWHQYVYHRLLNTLHVHIGKIIWHAGSMHLYDTHYDLLCDIVDEYNAGKELRLCGSCNSMLHWSDDYVCWMCDYCGHCEVTK